MIRTSIVLCCLLFAHAARPTQTPGAVTYEAFAVRFGILPAFPVSSLVAGADPARRLDIPVMVWLLKGSNGRQVLIDAGFYRQKFLDQWKPRDHRSPAAAVAAAGVPAEAITDIIISHAHWDHVDGADLFPKATVWIQREEYRYYTGDAWHARNTHGGVDAEDMAALLKINTDGRLRFVEGDDREILPGIRAYTGGRHTFASQYVSAATPAGTAVFTSDNVYLYENLDKRAAIAQTLDAGSNVKAQDRVRTLASSPRLIVPGHDPAVFERFERVGDGIVRIR
ncbi:MAG TPA: N-acyl homoserine lactonase family protein [Vicinamibacterales bacterium]|nr:N-acyl homoserine lactonase family protein [Vicinamibacterales bacterium]